jgi:UDP-N-acetylglucosamine--N-acetylmuramyl-(pentapeptide) pyrophosphoryl-undecaprenol N-acetylglucosamine transferase
VTVVFAGGGTGGHLSPAMASADALQRRRATISFIGAADRLEATIVPRAGYELHTIASHALPRTPSLALLRTIALNLKGTLQSLRLLAAQRPDLVIATGGYVCFPVAVAARIRRLLRLTAAPVVLLEPNAEPGVTTRLLTPMVDEVWGLGTTGVPVRSALRALRPRDVAMARLGLDPALRTLVAMGGSQGARSINDALVNLVERNAVPQGWQLLALTGSGDYDRVAGKLHNARPYLDDIADAYAAADLVLARAGASTLGELAALGKPAILVPYPHAAQAHQAANAARFEAAGAAVVLSDRDLQAGGLPALLARTVEPLRLQALAAGAARLEGADPLSAILARIDNLLSRNTKT